MKLKRLLPLLLVIALFCAVFVGCTTKETPPEHTHTYATEWSKDEGNHWHAATCEHTTEVKDKAAHTWDGGNVTTQPTETAKGEKTYTCTVCGQTKTEEVPMLEHIHTYSTEWTMDENEHWHAATCAHTTEVKDKAAHTWDGGNVTTQPTETTKGVKTYTCTVCGQTKTEEVPMLEHIHTYSTEWTVDENEHWHAATCAHTTEVQDKAAHSWDEGSITKEPTATEKGEKTYNCTVCGHKKTEEIPATGGGEVVLSPLPDKNKIYVVGDSTVCSFTDPYYLPRYGYGTQLANYLNVTETQIVNLALSGRSSKSFLTEENYTTLKDSIGEGDYLIIGFGHNDEKSAEPERFTDPNGTTAQENTAKGTSFKWCLNENYIKLAKEKGATPILCTPIVRYSSDADYTGAKAHITAAGNYPEAIIQLGAETGTTVIDLTALTKAVYLADNANAIYYHAHTTYEGAIKTTPYDGTEIPGGRDDTHINMYGAKMVAYQFATALKDSNSALRAHVKENIVAPTKAADYLASINTAFVKSAYEPFDPAQNESAKLAGDWYKSCMGELGGSSLDPFTITCTDESTFSITCTGGKGKIQGSSDGFASVFRQIPMNKNFTASATVKVNAMGGTQQAAFGMMLRDDIYMNKTAKQGLVLNSNYVAAGALTNKEAATTAIFSRENKKLNKSSNTVTLEAGSVVEVSIVRVGQTVTVKFGSATQVYTDFDFGAVDNGNMYLCLFATRDFGVEFTNVQFTVTGESQGA